MSMCNEYKHQHCLRRRWASTLTHRDSYPMLSQEIAMWSHPCPKKPKVSHMYNPNGVLLRSHNLGLFVPLNPNKFPWNHQNPIQGEAPKRCIAKLRHITWLARLSRVYIIELDDGKIYRKTLYLVKTMVSCDFPLNQSNEYNGLVFMGF